MPDTVEATIQDRLLARLAAYTPALIIAYPGVAFEPPAGIYVEAILLPNTNVNRGVSDNSATEFRGLFQVSVMAPAATPAIQAIDLAGKIAQHFERGAPISSNGFIIKIEGRPTVKSTPLKLGDRNSFPVTIRYSAFA